MSSVRGVSLYVPPGQSLALHSEPVGDSTELLDVIAGLRRPLSGQVTVDGVDVDMLSSQALDRYRLGLGLLSARYPLVPSLSALDNMLAGLLPDGQHGIVTRDRAAQLLATTGVTHPAEPAGAVPPEQQWRALIARALRTSPRLILAEDPTPGLDSRGATAILDLLMDLQAQSGFTLLLAVARVVTSSRCERLVRLAGGGIIEDVLISGDDPWTRGRIDRIG
jgi:putative ABC transport system ATP-binding protein